MNEEYLKELIVGIRVFLWMLSIKIKALSLTEFWKLLEGCSSQQKLYAVWLRYYFRRSDVMKIKEVNTNYILLIMVQESHLTTNRIVVKQIMQILSSSKIWH